MSHPTGNANVRAAACGLAEANLLFRFSTTIACFPNGILDRISTFPLFSDIKRRAFDPVLRPFTRTHPFYELGRLTASKTGFTKLLQHEKGIFCIDEVYKKLDNNVAGRLKQAAKKGVKAVYAYEDGALSSFNEARRIGLLRLYDLPTGYWRASQRLLQVERERWPNWASTITPFQDSCSKLARKDAELQSADVVFVASQFTAKTLEEYPGQLPVIEVIPYGFPAATAKRNYALLKGRRLKLLFVGKLSQQKGIADLFAAIEPLHSFVELTLVGNRGETDCFSLEAELNKHKWFPSLPHPEILQLMQETDVLVLPSLFDGFGLVITEAMSQGTPVIATERSAGPDLIEHDRNGWLFDAGSVAELQNVIAQILLDPKSISKTGREAVETAARRPWSLYKEELTSTVKKHLLKI